jgi:hypothetical protein
MQTFLNVAIWRWLARILLLHVRGPGIGLSVFFGWSLNDSRLFIIQGVVGT